MYMYAYCHLACLLDSSFPGHGPILFLLSKHSGVVVWFYPQPELIRLYKKTLYPASSLFLSSLRICHCAFHLPWTAALMALL